MLLLQLNPNVRSKKKKGEKKQHLKDYNFASVSQIKTISFAKGDTSVWARSVPRLSYKIG